MKQADIIKEINRLLPESKLATIKYVSDIFRAIHKRDSDFQYLGLKEAKDTIDAIQGMKNPGKKWMDNLKLINPLYFKELRYISI